MNLLLSRSIKAEGVSARRNRKENDIMKANLKNILGLAALGMTLLATTVPTWAGSKSTSVVYVEINQYWATASGSMVGARYSPDGTQFIGCLLDAQPNSPPFIRCVARNSAGNTAICGSVEPTHVQQVVGMTDSSYIYFLRNQTTGVCDRLRISNDSAFLK